MHAHVLLSTCGPLGLVPDGVCGAVSGVTGWTQAVAEAVQNPFRWLYHHTLGAPVPQQPGDPGWAACQEDWSQAACPKLIDELRPGRIPLAGTWPALYSAFAVSGVFIAATCCVSRVIRNLFDERVAGMHLVVDNVLRLVAAGGILMSPAPDHSFLLTAITWSATASGNVAAAAGSAIVSALGAPADLGVVVGDEATAGFANGGIGDFLVAIPILLAALGFVYVTALYLLRIVQLVFAVATAPLFVALAVYEPQNRFVRWWLDLFTSAMVLPLVLAVFGALTAGIAMQFLAGHTTGAFVGGGVEWVTRVLLTCFVILGGVWMTGKAVHGLAWGGFSHGGLTGAVTAMSTSIMALPNLAGSATGAVRAAGRFTGAGRSQPSGVGAPHLRADRLAATADHAAWVVAAAAGGQRDEVAGPPTAGTGWAADFASLPAAAGLVRGAGPRDAFNAALTAAVVRFASTSAGQVVVQTCTGGMADDTPYDQRVEAYAHRLAGDPVVGDQLCRAAVADLLHGRPPEVATVLGDRSPVTA